MEISFIKFYDDMLNALNWKAKGKKLNKKQKEAVQYGKEPFWIIAGPGSGKTEVLVWRTLKLILVDEINPRSIIITTFTEKAGKNLADRISQYVDKLITYGTVKFDDINVAEMRIGTLHSICRDVLQEYRYKNAQNKKLMDEIEQSYFAYRYSSMGKSKNDLLWRKFNQHTRKPFMTRWDKTKLSLTIFNRITEDLIDINKLKTSPDRIFNECANFYEEYLDFLEQKARYDFSTIQKVFLEFLDSPQGNLFLEGDPNRDILPLKYILIDEYQDTNPIQETIYFRLAGGHKDPGKRKKQDIGNMTIVGDDDQALYRFRGGTVDLLVNFDESCNTFLGMKPYAIQLVKNYRSHQGIVNWFNDYILYNPTMKGARAPGKLAMKSSKISPSGNWQPIGVIIGKTHQNTAEKVADIVNEISTSGQALVADDSHIVLLLRSTKESPRNAGPYVFQLRKKGLKVYNPRSRNVHEVPEVQQLIGALLEIIDPSISGTNPVVGYYLQAPMYPLSKTLSEFLCNCKSAYLSLTSSRAYPDLEGYIKNSITNISNLKGGKRVITLIQEILYKILNVEPFKTRLLEPNWGPRYSIITNLLEGFGSIYYGSFKRSNTTPHIVNRSWIDRFYRIFCGLIVHSGVNDYEDRERPIPKGYIQLMTYHQAKGLEFPYVFLGSLGDLSSPGAEHYLENIFMPFRKYPYTLTDKHTRAQQDDIRRYYMGFSRPKIGLIMFTHNISRCENSFGYDKSNTKRKDKTYLKKNGIQII